MCSNPDHHHGSNRVDFLINMVLSMPELRHGGYMVYEILGEDRLIAGGCLTDTMPRVQASPKIMVPIFLGAASNSISQLYDGDDPGWESTPAGQARPVGLMVKHRAGALRIRRGRPMSQGLMLALRDMTFRYACTTGKGVTVWGHSTRHPAGSCVCAAYFDAIEKIFPTCRTPV